MSVIEWVSGVNVIEIVYSVKVDTNYTKQNHHINEISLMKTAGYIHSHLSLLHWSLTNSVEFFFLFRGKVRPRIHSFTFTLLQLLYY